MISSDVANERSYHAIVIEDYIMAYSKRRYEINTPSTALRSLRRGNRRYRGGKRNVWLSVLQVASWVWFIFTIYTMLKASAQPYIPDNVMPILCAMIISATVLLVISFVVCDNILVKILHLAGVVAGALVSIYALGIIDTQTFSIITLYIVLVVSFAVLIGAILLIKLIWTAIKSGFAGFGGSMGEEARRRMR